MTDSPSLRVLVTGAQGNLGRKLVAHLVEAPWCSGIVALDCAAPPDLIHPKVKSVVLDLAQRSPALDAAMAEVDAAVHLAAQNPYPDASWDDGAVSFDMTLQAVEALARGGGSKRVVFASSNHVMGGYKEESVSPGGLTTDLPPRPGTRTAPGDVPRAYAAAKLMGERLLAAKAKPQGLSAVSLRIGWCQPGDNRPNTISAAGIPGEPVPDTPEAARELAWFRAMWLSNEDFLRAVSAALLADAAAWPTPAVVVNAMSDNRGMPWDLLETRRLIGYAPQDDSARELGQVSA
ncbi:MAG: NAD-dependent epimerase/dehydratase family protein [Janthinobacterium lividum]